MKFTNTLVGFCVLALVGLTTAQTKISGTAQCGKPDTQQKVDVPDHPGHAISMSQAKCTWSKPMEVAGLKSKEGVTTDMDDIRGDTAHGHGYYVDTMENGDKAFVSVTPFADYYTIDNRLMTTPTGSARRLYINREPGSTELTLWGTIPIDDPGANEGLAIEDPAEFAANLFRHLLGVRGIEVYGKQRTRHTDRKMAKENIFRDISTKKTRRNFRLDSA